MTMDYGQQDFGGFNQGLQSGALDPGQALQQLTNYLQQTSGGMQSGVTANQSQMGGQPMTGGNIGQTQLGAPMQSPSGMGSNQGFPEPGAPQNSYYDAFIQRGFTPDWAARADQLSPGALRQAMSGYGTRGFSAADDMLMTGRIGQMVGTGMNQQYQSDEYGGLRGHVGGTYNIPGMFGLPGGFNYPAGGGFASGGGLVNGPDNQWFGMPGTYSLPGAAGIDGGGGMPFGFQPGQGVPGGNASAFLQSMGLPVPNSVQSLLQGRGVGRPGQLGSAMQQLGGFGLPSPQALGNLSGSELEFFAGLMETLLGIPMSDVLSESRRPFKGLRTVRNARRR